jgi:hypothetical protein
MLQNMNSFSFPLAMVKKKAVTLRHTSAKGRRVYLHSRRGEYSATRPGRALPPVRIGIGGWVGLRAGLDTEARGKIICLCQRSNPGRPKNGENCIKRSCLSAHHSSSNIDRIIKLRGMRQAGHVVRIQDENSYKMLVLTLKLDERQRKDLHLCKRG